MKRRNIVGKALSVILICALGSTLFTGCGKNAGAEVSMEDAKKIDKNCIYKQEALDVLSAGGEKVEAIGQAGDRLAAICHTGDKADYISFNKDGSDVKSVEIENEIGHVVQAVFDNEGNAYILSFESTEGEKNESAPFLVKIDSTGKDVCRLNVYEELSGDDPSLTSIAFTKKYGLVCGTSEGLQTYDDKNGFQMLFEKENLGDIIDIVKIIELADGQLFTVCDNEEYLIIDIDDKKIAKKSKAFEQDDSYELFADENGDIYASDPDGIFKYDRKKDKLVKLLDYSDSFILSEELHERAGVVALNEKEFVSAVRDESGMSVVKFNKVNPEDVKDKTVITLACLSNDIDRVVSNFNRSSDKYVIKVINYDRLYEDDCEEGLKQFNLDIISGKAADIICFDGNESNIKKYVEKGILLDLTSFFDKGGALEDMELLPNIAEMMKYNGKTYTFMPRFRVNTYVARSEHANGKTFLTFDDCDKLIKSKGVDYNTAFGFFGDKETLSSSLCSCYGDKFIDWKNMKCDYNSPEFINVLNFVNKFSDTTYEDEEDMEVCEDSDPYVLIAEGKGLFGSAYFGNIWEYAEFKQVVYKSDIEFVGCPNNLGENIAGLSGSIYAVNGKTEHKDAICDVMRELFDSDKQSGFYSVRSKFEEQLQEATNELSDDDSNAYVFDPLTEEKVKLKALTQEEVKKFYDYAVSIETYEVCNYDILNIISEETAAFYEGQKTAEEVADIIQNRVSNYVGENS